MDAASVASLVSALWTQQAAAFGPLGAPVQVLDIQLPTPSNNEVKEAHYQVYRKLRERWWGEVLNASGGQRPAQPVEHAFLRIHRRCHGIGLDWDNAYGGLKPLLDCLVVKTARNPCGLGFIRDDSPRVMPLPPLVTQETAPPGKGGTLVEIYSLSPRNSNPR